MKAIKYIDRSTGKIITERPPGEGYLRWLYYNPLGKLALHAIVKRKLLSTLYGRRMSSVSSRQKIQPFVDAYHIDMSEAIQPVSAFTSFNDFFYRKLKPESRPLGDGLVSPADGKVLAFEQVSDVSTFFIKGDPFTLERFLADSTLATRYQDSSMIIVRLAPNDYHRFHFPASGVPSSPTEISGHYYSVSPYALMPNFARVFCENKRELVSLTTEKYGDILLCPVGATMVGSIIETYTPDRIIDKGEEMGYFAFGGSTIVLLVDRSKVQIDSDLLQNTKAGMETSIKMGQTIAQPLST